jgi:hypothetical protein
MTRAQIKKKLDLIAKHINELDTALKDEYGHKAYIYFESEGTLHAMAGSGEREDSSRQRQKQIIESSNFCRFDCGAW